jgi:hypothetical protein
VLVELVEAQLLAVLVVIRNLVLQPLQQVAVAVHQVITELVLLAVLVVADQADQAEELQQAVLPLLQVKVMLVEAVDHLAVPQQVVAEALVLLVVPVVVLLLVMVEMV